MSPSANLLKIFVEQITVAGTAPALGYELVVFAKEINEAGYVVDLENLIK
jgi:hypothetical protein